jgi:hypothetical protein
MQQYKVITNGHIDILERDVNELLAKGWQLAGGISAAYKHEHSANLLSHLVYSQALVKEANDQP